MSPNQPAKKGRKEFDEEERLRYHARWMHAVYQISSILKFGVVGFFAWAVTYTGVYLPVQASAGLQTTVNVFYQWLFDANIHVYVAWAVAGGCGLYARSQRKKRLAERETKDKRIIELEKMIDRKRETSGVSTEGEAG
jgi:hypothetical protein